MPRQTLEVVGVYRHGPLTYHGAIPVFSRNNEYLENYEQISTDHIDSFRKKGTNPFIPEDMWVEFEESTLALVKKFSEPGARILDVGVGMGRLLSKLEGWDRYGMDISFGYLEISQDKGIEVCYAMAEDMPYKEDIFDVVVCTDVLEHVLDLNLVCTKMLSVLKNKGMLIVRVPYRENLMSYCDPTYPYKFAHLRSFDEHSLQLLFERVFGCRIMERSFAGYTDIVGDKHRMKALLKVFDDYLLVRFNALLQSLKRPFPSVFAFLVKRLYNAIVINVVVQKQTRDET